MPFPVKDEETPFVDSLTMPFLMLEADFPFASRDSELSAISPEAELSNFIALSGSED